MRRKRKVLSARSRSRLAWGSQHLESPRWKPGDQRYLSPGSRPGLPETTRGLRCPPTRQETPGASRGIAFGVDAASAVGPCPLAPARGLHGCIHRLESPRWKPGDRRYLSPGSRPGLSETTRGLRSSTHPSGNPRREPGDRAWSGCGVNGWFCPLAPARGLHGWKHTHPWHHTRKSRGDASGLAFFEP
jgi:hypothetical protein